MYRYNPENIGWFTEQEFGQEFTYRLTTNVWAMEHGLLWEFDVGNDSWRYAKVKRTVIYVAFDEADDGSPVLAKWKLKKHVVYAEGNP